MADITIVNGVYKPTYNWGAPPCMNHCFHWHRSGTRWSVNEWSKKLMNYNSNTSKFTNATNQAYQAKLYEIFNEIIEQTSLPFFPINQHVRHLNPLDTFDTVADFGCSPAPGQNGSALLRPGASRGDQSNLHRIHNRYQHGLLIWIHNSYILHRNLIKYPGSFQLDHEKSFRNIPGIVNKPTLAAMVGSLAFLLSLPQQSLANPINPWLVALRKWYNLIHIN